MTRNTLIVLVTFLMAMSAKNTTVADDGWPMWRGASQNGVAQGSEFPTRWSNENGVAWEVVVPGKGSSTPVVSGNSSFMTSGIDGKNVVLSIDLTNGKVLWETPLGSDRGNKHKKGGGSNPSAVSEGDQVFAYFRSGDLGCVGVDGKVRWHVNLQDMFGEDTLWWDLGSSPMLTDNAVVIAVMQSGPSYLVAFDKESGAVIWKQDRMLGAPEEAAQSYSTPLAVTINGKDAIAVMGADHLTLHDAGDGDLLGKLGGFNPTDHKYFRSISSPVADGNLIVCPYARGESVTCVRMDQVAAGKGTDAIAWFRDDLGSDVPTPAIKDGRVYLVGDGNAFKGNVACLDLNTGKTIWTIQLPKSRIGLSSSPLIAGDNLYVTAEDATTHVIGPISSDQPKLLSSNPLDDDEPFTVASLIPIGKSLLLRSKSHLYRIGGE